MENEDIRRVLEKAQKTVDESNKAWEKYNKEPSRLRLVGRLALAAAGLIAGAAVGALGMFASFKLTADIAPEAPFMATFLSMPSTLGAGYLGISSWELGKESLQKLRAKRQ